MKRGSSMSFKRCGLINTGIELILEKKKVQQSREGFNLCNTVSSLHKITVQVQQS